MRPTHEESEHTNHLRQRAEEALRGQAVDLTDLPPEDVQSLLHELQVYQVELRMQNEELRRVQLELEASRDRYSDLYHFAPIGYCTLNRKGVIREANQTLIAMLGVAPDRLINTPIDDFVQRDDRDVVYLHCRRAFATHERQVSEIRMQKETGGEIVVRLESVIAHGDENRLMVVLSDVTERKHAEAILAETQGRLRIVLENAPLDLYTTDCELRYTWTFGSLYGLPPEAVLGKRDDELFPQAGMKEVIALKQLVLDSGVGRRGEVRFQLDRQTRVLDMTVEPLLGEKGEVAGLTAASIDMTQQREMERAALESTAQREVQHRLLDQREQERQQIAHDLHDGPVQELTGITFTLRALLNSEEMSAETHPAETAQELETIQKRLQGLISELRTYAGELRPPTLSKFGLEGTIRSHMETFQEKHPEPHIVLDLHQNSEILSETIGVALFRIYQQALNNIIKHAQASEASVQMEEDQDQVRLIIQDNGQGFVVPEDWINLARHGHLGLLGMRERAEAVGGKFEVTSVPGKGTQIIVTIPLDPLGGERRTHLI